MDEPRLSPVRIDETDDETRALVLAGAGRDGRVLNIFATLAHHPKLLKRWLVFGAHVLAKSTLPPRDRELLILRTGWNCHAPYEWGQHVAIAREIAISDEEIVRCTRPDVDGWEPFDATLIRAADELHRATTLSDETWAALHTRYTDQQVLDVIFTVGQYHVVSMALNSCRVQRDDPVTDIPMPPPAQA